MEVVAEPKGGVTRWRGRRRVADRWFNAGGGAPMIALRGRGLAQQRVTAWRGCHLSHGWTVGGLVGRRDEGWSRGGFGSAARHGDRAEDSVA
jgi:hypothetical protein